MGISHEYHSAPRRARHGTVSGRLRFLGAVIAILLVSYAITAILEKGAEGADDTPSINAGGIAENILAPLPMQQCRTGQQYRHTGRRHPGSIWPGKADSRSVHRKGL